MPIQRFPRLSLKLKGKQLRLRHVKAENDWFAKHGTFVRLILRDLKSAVKPKNAIGGMPAIGV